MTFKDQWNTVKENWILALIILVVLFVPVFSGGFSGSSSSFSKGMIGTSDMMVESAMVAPGGVYYDSGFAPKIEERKITKSASLSTEVERGEFKQNELALKGLITSLNGIITNENVNLYGQGKSAYYYGHYTVKFPTSVYDDFVEQLKLLGEVQSFNENARDITEQYYDIKTELAAEKEKLARFQQMYSEVKDISDKISISDKIFDQERRVKYLEEAMENKDLQVDYSTVSITLQEERSGYAGMAVVKFSQLIKGFVNSFNNLLQLIFYVVPWAIAVLAIWFAVRVFRRRT
jgi:hypothetical protein